MEKPKCQWKDLTFKGYDCNNFYCVFVYINIYTHFHAFYTLILGQVPHRVKTPTIDGNVKKTHVKKCDKVESTRIFFQSIKICLFFYFISFLLSLLLLFPYFSLFYCPQFFSHSFIFFLSLSFPFSFSLFFSHFLSLSPCFSVSQPLSLSLFLSLHSYKLPCI